MSLRRGAFALLFGVCLSACGSETPSESLERSAAFASTVELADVEGVQAALQARRGKAVLLNLWAMW